MVTIYNGCSCSLEDMLISSGIPVQNAQEDKVVSMYETNIESVPVGRFLCPNTVVSMRPVRKDHLEKLVAITGKYDAVHGAPVHIGDPAMIGIADIAKPEHGNPARIDEGHVPVFWACGVTTSKALRSAKPEICFTHHPGCVFICDPTCGEYFHSNPSASHGNEQHKVIPLQDEPFFASILGETVFQQISQLERIIQDDPGRRNIKALLTPGELVKASLRLSHASSVAIVTGFPVMVGKDPPDETDGPPGALTTAKALQALGKNVTLVASHYNTKLMNQFVSDCVQSGVLKEPINVEEFTPSRGESDEEAAIKFLYPSGAEKEPRFDALVAIEAVGRTEQGAYRTMRKVDLLPCCSKSPVDELFIQAGRGRKGSISTIGIGDGGNEIGMGNVREKVAQHIENGADIACSVTVDHLITAGVSNWGGWALAMSLVALQNCRIHSRYVRRGTGEHRPVSQEDTLNTVQQERKVLESLVSRGVCDGIRGKAEMSVDGLDFDSTHVAKLEELFAVLK